MKTLKMVNLKKIILIMEEPVGLVAGVMQMLKNLSKPRAFWNSAPYKYSKHF